MKPIVLVVGARATVRLSEIVTDSNLLARLEGAHGAWTVVGDSVSFRTPTINRAQVEVQAIRPGRAVVSFIPGDFRVADQPAGKIQVVATQAEVGKAEEEAERKDDEEEQLLVEAEAQRKAEEEAHQRAVEDARRKDEEQARLKAETERDALTQTPLADVPPPASRFDVAKDGPFASGPAPSAPLMSVATNVRDEFPNFPIRDAGGPIVPSPPALPAKRPEGEVSPVETLPTELGKLDPANELPPEEEPSVVRLADEFEKSPPDEPSTDPVN